MTYYTDSTKPITEKQIAFLRRLANERGAAYLPDGTEIANDRDLLAVPRHLASRYIDELLATPVKAQEPAPATAPISGGLDLSGLHGGYYAARIDGVTKFFKIDRVTEGKWAGWTFVKIQASDDLHRQGSQKPGQAYRGASQDYLAEILDDEQQAMEMYGRQIGRCGHCGRTLTDEASRARGIGPICADKMGW